MFVHTPNIVFANSKSSVDFHWFKGSSNLHYHTYYEIFIIFRGTFDHFYNGKTIKLTRGDCIVVVPDREHLLTSSLKSDLHANFSITEKAFKKLTEEYSKDLFNYLTENSGIPFKLDEDKLHFIESMLNNSLFTSEKEFQEYRYLTLIHLILGFLSIKNEQIPYDSSMPKWLNEILGKIHNPEVFCQPLSNIYKLSNYSPSRFTHVFTKYLNTSPIKYMTNLKIEYAKKLLAKTNYDLQYISSLLNFSSYSYFSNIFKKNTGYSPLDFRKEQYFQRDDNY